MKAYRLAYARGLIEPRTTPDEESRLRLEEALRHVSAFDAEKATGVNREYFYRYLSGQLMHAEVQRRVRSAVPTVEALAVLHGTRTSVRKLRSLIAFGYSPDSIAAAGGPSARTTNTVLRGGSPRAATRRRISAAFTALSGKRGDHRPSFRRAALNGWFSPLAWDDIARDEQPLLGVDAYHGDAGVTLDELRRVQREARAAQ